MSSRVRTGIAKCVGCSILHEEQLFIIVTLRNNGKHEIVKHIQALSYLVYNHPAVCIFSEILISKCPSRAFMRNSGSINERVICGNRTQKLKMSSFRFEFSKDISVVTIYYYDRVYFKRQVISFHNISPKPLSIQSNWKNYVHLCVS